MSFCCHTTCDCIKDEVKMAFVKSLVDIRKAVNGINTIPDASTEVGIVSLNNKDKNYYQFDEEDKRMLRCYMVSILGGGISGEYGKPQKWVYDDCIDTLEQTVIYDARNIAPKHRKKYRTLMNKIEGMTILYINKKHSRPNGISEFTEAEHIYSMVVKPKLI